MSQDLLNNQIYFQEKSSNINKSETTIILAKFLVNF